MLKFENTEFLYGLLLLPIFWGLYILVRYLRKRKLEKFGEKRLIEHLMPEVSGYKPLIKFSLLMLALASTIIALANPQIGTKIEEVKREGVNVMLALDVSNSMYAEDIKPNRIERAKRLIMKLIDQMTSDRIGIIVFAGEAFVQLPLTTDYSAVKLFVSTLSPALIETQGTAIGRSINLAIRSFPEEDKKHKTLIIITDGENHEDDALGAAEAARKEGIIIHTIGMGTVEGGPIPVYRGGNLVDYRKDRDGSLVVTKLDSQMLQQIAQSGGGRFIRVSGADPDLAALLDEIGKMEKQEFDTKIFTQYEDRFQYFVALALIFLFMEFFISERKNKWLANLKLFDSKKL